MNEYMERPSHCPWCKAPLTYYEAHGEIQEAIFELLSVNGRGGCAIGMNGFTVTHLLLKKHPNWNAHEIASSLNSLKIRNIIKGELESNPLSSSVVYRRQSRCGCY